MLFAPLAFFLPETMPFLGTDLQTKSDFELDDIFREYPPIGQAD